MAVTEESWQLVCAYKLLTEGGFARRAWGLYHEASQTVLGYQFSHWLLQKKKSKTIIIKKIITFFSPPCLIVSSQEVNQYDS